MKAFVHGLVHELIEFTWTKFIHAISPEICSAKISKHTTLFRSLISCTRRLTWLQKMLREIGESPAGSASIFRKWKEQTAWSLVEVNAERLICPNQDFSTWFVTIFACKLTSPHSSFPLSVSRPSTQRRGLLINSSRH